MKDHQDNDAPEYDGPSKSQLKREMHALQDLGKRMLDLSNDQLETLPISETLRAAIEESRRIRQNEAKRRHLQYIGKVIPKPWRKPSTPSMPVAKNTPADITWRNAGGTG